MFGAGVLASALLASVATAQMNQLRTAWTTNPGSATLDFGPSTFPVDPSQGWNFTTLEQSDGVSLWIPPLFDREPRAYTTLRGANVTAHFYGHGAAGRGRVFEDNSTISLTLDGDRRFTNSTVLQGSADYRKLIEIYDDDPVNRWRTLTITLQSGGMQLRNVSFLQTVTMGYQYTQDAPYMGVNATQFDTDEIDKFYTTTGNWKTEKLLEPNCEFCNYLSADILYRCGDGGTTCRR